MFKLKKKIIEMSDNRSTIDVVSLKPKEIDRSYSTLKRLNYDWSIFLRVEICSIFIL